MGPGTWNLGRGGVRGAIGSEIALESRRFKVLQVAYRFFAEEPPLTVEYPGLQSAQRWDKKSR